MYINTKVRGCFFVFVFSSKGWKSGRGEANCVDIDIIIRSVNRLLSKEDFAGGTETLAGLGRAFVGACLKTDHRFAGSQLFLRELTFAFL